MTIGVLFCRWLGFLALTTATLFAADDEAAGVRNGVGAGKGTEPSLVGRIIEAIAPQAMKKRPMIRFHAFTEMTDEGRKRPAASSQQPVYYASRPARFVQHGWEVAPGERPPPVAELETAIQGALKANGFLPVPGPEVRPALMVVLHYGSHGTDIAPGTAEELVAGVSIDPSRFKDVVERATLIGGEKFARELKEAIADGPPFFMLGVASAARAQFIQAAFHTCYFVIASAYDFDALERGEKRLLWRTRMAVEAQGVSMEEILGPLILNAGELLGRETPDHVLIEKRILRDGNVEVGTPTVVEEVRTSSPQSRERR